MCTAPSGVHQREIIGLARVPGFQTGLSCGHYWAISIIGEIGISQLA